MHGARRDTIACPLIAFVDRRSRKTEPAVDEGDSGNLPQPCTETILEHDMVCVYLTKHTATLDRDTPLLQTHVGGSKVAAARQLVAPA